MSENLIIFNARIVTPIGFSARKGEEMSQLQVIENGTVEVTKGIITYVAAKHEMGMGINEAGQKAVSASVIMPVVLIVTVAVFAI